MCHQGKGRFESAGHDLCGCSSSCPVTMTVEEEIRLLEEHQKIMQDQLGGIVKKLASLKATRES